MPSTFPLGQNILFVDTVAPTASSDQGTLGARRGHWWLNTSTSQMYVCTSAVTGAAVWKQVVNTDRQILANNGIVASASTLISDITLSLDGVASATHNETRGPGATDLLEFPRNAELAGAAYLDPFSIGGHFPISRTSSYTITSIDFRKLIIGTSGTITLTLPTASTLPNGWWCMYRNRTGVDMSIARAGSDTLNAGATVVSVATGTAIGRIIKTSNTTYEVG